MSNWNRNENCAFSDAQKNILEMYKCATNILSSLLRKNNWVYFYSFITGTKQDFVIFPIQLGHI